MPQSVTTKTTDVESRFQTIISPYADWGASLPPFRVLVTGSRDWRRISTVHQALVDAWRNVEPFQQMVVVHGECPTGADIIAKVWALHREEKGVVEEGHQASWHLGRKAGPIRNQGMVDKGADLCLAFLNVCTKLRCQDKPTHFSHGASGCADMAEEAGIKTLRFY